MNVMILIGFMGAGKTTIGKALSDTIYQPFYDLDHEITKDIKMPIADYFAQHGERMFRELEVQYLANYAQKNAIISTGGGCIESLSNRDLLLDRQDVIYLKADFDTLLYRIQKDQLNKRPTAKNKSYNELKAVLTHRIEYYEQCADYIIHTDEKSIKQIVNEIISETKLSRHPNLPLNKRSIL